MKKIILALMCLCTIACTKKTSTYFTDVISSTHPTFACPYTHWLQCSSPDSSRYFITCDSFGGHIGSLSYMQHMLHDTVLIIPSGSWGSYKLCLYYNATGDSLRILDVAGAVSFYYFKLP